MLDFIITDNVSYRKFCGITLQILYRITEAFGESTDRHRALMQNNTAMYFLTDQYGFFSTDCESKDRGFVTVVCEGNLDLLRHYSLLR